MKQRQVRVGDVLDDYCPHERRVTDHAVVALVGREIKLTRCTTCDSEHPYREARVPPRRQTRLVAALSSAGAAGTGPALQGQVSAGSAAPGVTAPPDPPPPQAVEPAAPLPVDSVRRPLIRATLERPEGTPPPSRSAPVFTIRENTGRDGGFDRAGRKRRNGGRPSGEPNGNRVEGSQGHVTRPGQAKNGSRPLRSRGSASRFERPNKGQPRTRGKGRSR